MCIWTKQRSRKRKVWLGLFLGTIFMGLGSRHFAALLPSWLAKNAGDILYATMVFWLLGLLAPRVSTLRASLAAIAFCLLIEFSKFYHGAWFEAIRGTEPGRLVLGFGFHPSNLICYALGIGIGAALEIALLKYEPPLRLPH